MRVLQYSIDGLGRFIHPEGTMRVSLHDDRVVTDIKAGGDWSERAMGPDTERLLHDVFIGMGKVELEEFDGSTEEASGRKLLFIREHDMKLHFHWYSRKPGEKWEMIDQEKVPIEMRCLLKGRCAVSLQDRGFSPKLEAR